MRIFLDFVRSNDGTQLGLETKNGRTYSLLITNLDGDEEHEYYLGRDNCINLGQELVNGLGLNRYVMHKTDDFAISAYERDDDDVVDITIRIDDYQCKLAVPSESWSRFTMRMVELW